MSIEILKADLRTDVVFIDGQLKDIDKIIQSLRPGTEVVVLDGSKDGFAEMAGYLAGRHDIDAITLVSHGETGAVKAGNVWLTQTTLAAHADALRAIGSALTADGDLLLYGCKVGAGNEGQALLSQIAAITSADVAGSVDNTGGTALGGNWTLERHTGAIEAPGLAGVLGAYDALLAAPTYETFDAVTLPDDGGIRRYLQPGEDLTSNGWALGLRDLYGNADVNTQLVVTNQSVDTVLADGAQDKALIMIGNYTTYSAVVKSTSGDEFSLHSITVEDFSSGNTQYKLVGYQDGVQVSGATLDFTMASYGTTVNGQVVSVSGSAWQYVDEVRIVYQNGQGGVSLSIDDINVSSAVSPNVVPVISNLNGDAITYVEGSGPVKLDASQNAIVTDTDSTDFDGGTLTVAIVTNNVTAQDVLTIVHQGNAAGQIGVSGNLVSYEGTAIGTSTGGTLGTNLVISFNANATPTAVQALVRDIAFNNVSEDPLSLTRTVRFALKDGDSNNTSAASDVTVNVQAVNDAPTLSTSTSTPTYTENGGAVSLFSGTSISTIESSQSVRTLTINVSNVSDGASEVLSIDGTSVALFNGNSLTTSTLGLSVSVSVSGGMATVTMDKSTGISAASAQALVNNLSYRDTSEAPTAGNRVVTLTSVRDTGGVATGGSDTTSLFISSTVTVVAVNDAAVLTTSGGSAAFTAGDNTASTPVVIDSGLTLSDVDNTTLASATVSITGNFRSGEDQLVFVNNNPALYGNISASYDAATGAMSLTSASNSATIAQWQAALRSVQYTDSAITPNTSTRTISFVVNDGTNDSVTANRTVTVAATDQTPVLSNSGGSGLFTEGQGPVQVDPGLTVSDLDNATLASATVQITGNFHGGEDLLQFTNTSSTLYGNIVGSYNAATGALTLSSAGGTATLSQWQGALRDVNYSNTSESPDTNSRTISFSVNDGTKNSAVDTRTVGVAAVNDAPTVANSIADQIAPEDTTFNFQIPSNAFTDVDVGDTLAFSAQLTGGGVLPAWLIFNSVTRTFSGTPLNQDVGVLSIDVTVDDGHGGSVTDTFQLVVSNTNDAPTVANAISNRTATEGFAFSYTFAANTFADVDVGDTLGYTAQLAGGGALPAWLSFNPATRTFSGTPAGTGTVSIEVTANDGHGGSVSDSFDVVISAAPMDPEPPVTPPVTPPVPGVPDNDGIPPAVEDQVPGIPGPGGNTTPGDGNGDGIKDSEQPSVGSIGFVLSPTGESNPGSAPPTFTTLVASSQDGKVGSGNDNARITSLTQKDAPPDLPAGMQMPIGLVSFTVELGQGKTGENFSLYVDPALGVNGYWKENASGQWVNIASEPYGGKMVMEGGRLRLDFHIEDGGQFDADGKVDGIITDPGAPGHMALSIMGMAPDMPHGFWF